MIELVVILVLVVISIGIGLKIRAEDKAYKELVRDFDNIVMASTVKPPLYHNGRELIDGIDYFGDHDYELIAAYGYDSLNFYPSTPPEVR